MQGREYQRYQGPSLKEKPKQKTHQWGGDPDSRIIPVPVAAGKGTGVIDNSSALSIPAPAHPLYSFPPPHPPSYRTLGDQQVDPLTKGRGRGRTHLDHSS